MEATLLLNATFEPLKVISWQRAMTLWCQNKVEIVESHGREVRAVRFTFKLPSVVRLLRYAKIRRRADFVPFTRANIYARDGYSCQYCRQEFPDEDLTFDHVIPASRGGPKSWTNIVTACITCNRAKGGRTPEEAGMTLASVPKKPEAQMMRVTLGYRKAPANWHSYLYWNVELDTQ